MLDCISNDISFRKISINCEAYAAPNKGTQVLRHNAGQEGRGEILLENSFLR